LDIEALAMALADADARRNKVMTHVQNWEMTFSKPYAGEDIPTLLPWRLRAKAALEYTAINGTDNAEGLARAMVIGVDPDKPFWFQGGDPDLKIWETHVPMAEDAITALKA
jgi:hypothetical protein